MDMQEGNDIHILWVTIFFSWHVKKKYSLSSCHFLNSYFFSKTADFEQLMSNLPMYPQPMCINKGKLGMYLLTFMGTHAWTKHMSFVLLSKKRSPLLW